MTLGKLQIAGLVIVILISLIAFPATLYWLKIVHTTSYPLLMRKKYVYLSLLTCIFCILWLIYLPFLITAWTFREPLHLDKHLLSLSNESIDIFVNNGILWAIVARYWMLFFHSHWTSITQQYIWIHIRGSSTHNPRGFIDLSHLFWIKNQSLGRYDTVKRRMIFMLYFLFLPLIFALVLAVYNHLSLNTFHLLCFVMYITPHILIILLWFNMPIFKDNIAFKTQMHQFTSILLTLFILRLIPYIYGFCAGFVTDIYYALYICTALFVIFSLLCIQIMYIQSDLKEMESQYDDMNTDIINDILRYVLKSEKLTQEFIRYLAKEYCLEYILAFVELTQLRHLMESIYLIHEELPQSRFASLYGRINLTPSIPRSSVVHNRKYSRCIRKEQRIAKIARKLVQKYFRSDSVFALQLNSDKIVECSKFEKWDALLVEFETIRATLYDVLSLSVWRLCVHQKSNEKEVFLNGIKIDFLEELESNNWVTLIDTDHMTMDTAVIYEQFMSSFPLSFNVLKLLKIEKNFECNLRIYKSILDTLSNQRERVLFHGTSIENIKRIICDGFNPDFNVRCVYGKGVYFAESSDRAAKYCIKDVDSECYAMLICRVIVGDYTVGHRPNEGNRDCMEYQCDNITQYDSLVDDLLCPAIFVINRDYRAIPEYMVVFQK